MKAKENFIVSISMVCLTLLTVFIADWVGLIPDETESKVQERVNLSEALAIQLAAAMQKNNLEIAQITINSVVERNYNVLSIQLTKSGGTLVARYGDVTNTSTLSTPDSIKVPLINDDGPVGTVEVNFIPLQRNGWFKLFDNTFFRLTIFIALFTFVLYFIMVNKVLRNLDPSKVIPARVKKALDTVSHGLVFIDNKDQIMLANAAFEKNIMLPPERVLGEKLSNLGWEDLKNPLGEIRPFPWNDTINNGTEHKNVTLKYHITDNDILTLIINTTPLFNNKGGVSGALVSFNDVTELGKINYELESMTKFIRHEMSNALMGASSSVVMLEQSEDLSEGGKQLVNHAQRLHKVLKHLLESVKEAKSIESSFSKDETYPLSIAVLVRDMVSNFSDVYNNNEFKFESDGNELIVNAQEERIIQMLDKLVSNAVDHADVDTPIIFFCYKDGNRAVIKVVNQGHALPEDKDKIFDLFASFQSNNTHNENQGIGLYVVKLIANGYGGSVIANDRMDNTGAEFIVNLPLH